MDSKLKNMNKILKILFVLLSITTTWAQERPHQERILARAGNEAFIDSNFVEAELKFRQSIALLDFDTNRYNMALSLLLQEKTKEAKKEFQVIAKKSENKALKSLCELNSGICVVKEDQKQALEHFKQALRHHPKNELARHNYWFLKMMMKNQPPQQDQDNQDQNNKDQNKNQENKEDQGDGNNKDQQNKDGKQEGDNKNKDEKKDQEGNSDQNKDDKDQSEDQKGDSEKEDDQKSDEQEKPSEKEEKPEQGEDSDEKNKDSEKGNDEGDEEKEKPENEGDNDADAPEENQEGAQDAGDPQEMEEGMSENTALRLLESIDREEEKTQKKIKAKLLKGKKKQTEKDW